MSYLNRALAACALTLAMLSAFLVIATQAQAAPQKLPIPYGGCAEAVPYYLDTPGAQDCRDHGWVLRPRLAINPHGVLVRSALPHCRYEDGSGQRVCLWDSSVDGINGAGLSYIVRKGHATYVWTSTPVAQRGVRWVTPQLDKALDRMVKRHKWTRCAVQVGPDTEVRCPEGVRVAL